MTKRILGSPKLADLRRAAPIFLVHGRDSAAKLPVAYSPHVLLIHQRRRCRSRRRTGIAVLACRRSRWLPNDSCRRLESPAPDKRRAAERQCRVRRPRQRDHRRRHFLRFRHLRLLGRQWRRLRHLCQPRPSFQRAPRSRPQLELVRSIHLRTCSRSIHLRTRPLGSCSRCWHRQCWNNRW